MTSQSRYNPSGKITTSSEVLIALGVQKDKRHPKMKSVISFVEYIIDGATHLSPNHLARQVFASAKCHIEFNGPKKESAHFLFVILAK